MKHLLKWLCGGLALCMPLSVRAIALQEVERGHTLTLAAPTGYAAYQWQVSTNGGKSYLDIPGGSVRELSVKVNVPATYRVVGFMNNGQHVYADSLQVALTAQTYSAVASAASAAQGYVDSRDGKPGVGGITIPEAPRDANNLPTFERQLTNWTSTEAMAVYYFWHPQAVVDTRMVMTAALGQQVNFKVTIWNPQDLSEPLGCAYLTTVGTGRPDTVMLSGFNVPAMGYYRYQLECLNGCQNIRNIDRFLFASTAEQKSYVASYLTSPSVHLYDWRSTQSGAPTGDAYDWCYQEVMLPASADVIGTYVMSLGVLSGYMGIQMNGYDEQGKSLHEVLFSMWDDGNTEEDPNLPEYLRAGAVDWADYTTVKRFGGEGTGIQTFVHGHQWECGRYVQFLTNCRPEIATYTVVENGVEQVRQQENRLVSAWYNALDGRGWQYISTVRLPNSSKYFNSWYSFLENYNFPTGQAVREAYYRNGYARSRYDGKWYHFNQVSFSHTDGGVAEGARNDWGQGASDKETGAFFMRNGGYLPTDMRESMVPLNAQHTPVDTIALEPLLQRVDQGVANEQKRIRQDEAFEQNLLNKSGWEVLSFSSEETAGEPNGNGLAKWVIDGNNDTYWHSRWTSSTAAYPHTFVIDMKQVYDISAFRITMSGGSNRYIQAFDVYGSLDNENWTLVYSTDEAPDEESFRFSLTRSAQMRYFKLMVRSGRATDGPFVRINEIDVSGSIPEGIGQVTAAVSNSWQVVARGRTVEWTAPFAAEKAVLTLYSAAGQTMWRQTYPALHKGQTCTTQLPKLAPGVYVLAIRKGNEVYARHIRLF